jgi:hypothetical protein
MTNFVFDALLRGVHGIPLAAVDSLQRLLHLHTQRFTAFTTRPAEHAHQTTSSFLQH